ncbi:MAG: OmpA family protein [Rubrivivax sp.]
MKTTPLQALAAALLLMGGAAAQAQAPAPVLKMNQVTEQALVDALDIGETGAEEGARTRSIRPTARSNNNSGNTPSRVAAGKSNLLITFNTNSAELTHESKNALGTVAKAMQSDKLAPYAFSVEGHADPRGSADLNQRLSAARAQSVVNYLVAAQGIAADRLSPVGKGSAEPLNTERPDAPENRRVTIVTKRQ